MAAPLTNEVWIYGDDDDTLFRLITLGTGSSVRAARFRNKALCARAPRTWSGRCRLTARSSKPMMKSGRSSPGLGR